MKFLIEDVVSDLKHENISIEDALRANPAKERALKKVAKKIYDALPDLLEEPSLYSLPMDEFQYVLNVANALSDKQGQVSYFGEELSPRDFQKIFFSNRDDGKPLRDTGLYDHAKDTIWDQVEYWSNPNREQGADNSEVSDKTSEGYRLLSDMFDKDLGRYNQLCRKYGNYLEDGKDTHGYLRNILSGQLQESSMPSLSDKENALLTLLYNAFQSNVFRGNIRVFLFNYVDALINQHTLSPKTARKILKLEYDKNSPWRKYIS